VGIGDFSHSSAIERPLTTVRLPARRIGQMAAKKLIEQLHTGVAPAEEHTVIPPELVV